MFNHRQARRRDNLILRAKIMQSVRLFFDTKGFLEVETPSRIPAPIPEAHIEAVASESWCLQTSPELCMKRLLAAGYENIYQICKCFRKNERGHKHIPELTMLEWYHVGKDYRYLMDDCQGLIQYVAQNTGAGDRLVYGGRTIDLSGDWDTLTVKDSFKKYADLSMEEALAQGDFDEVMGLTIEPCLGLEKPVFLYDYPAEKGALARRRADDPDVAERFELYIAGVELCNAFSELTDATEQRLRFLEEQAYKEKAGDSIYPIPEKFLKSVEEMPEAAGIALGLDRLVMLFAGADAIDDVIAFTPEDL